MGDLGRFLSGEAAIPSPGGKVAAHRAYGRGTAISELREEV